MKLLLTVLSLLAATSNALALTELGVVGGITTNYQSSQTVFATYGLTAAIQFDNYSVGVKAVNMSGPATTATAAGITTITNTGQINILGQFKYTMMGFFAGLNLGMGIQNASITTSGVSTGGGSITALVYGPTVGYYMGSNIKYGLELDYILATFSGWTNNLVPMAGIKFSI